MPIPEELLRQPEEKKLTPSREDISSGSNFDEVKFRGFIALRRHKLEEIKSFLHLKTAHQISEKIDAEEKTLEQIIKDKKQAKVAKKEEPIGILPKTFFELKTLKPKSIRID